MCSATDVSRGWTTGALGRRSVAGTLCLCAGHSAVSLRGRNPGEIQAAYLKTKAASRGGGLALHASLPIPQERKHKGERGAQREELSMGRVRQQRKGKGACRRNDANACRPAFSRARPNSAEIAQISRRNRAKLAPNFERKWARSDQH